MPTDNQAQADQERAKANEEKKRKRTLLDMLKAMSLGDEPGMVAKTAEKAQERERRRREILQMEQ
jgi:hypothetical protein